MQCDKINIFRHESLQGIEGGMTNLAEYQDWENHILCMSCENVILCVYCECGTGLIMFCICADDLMWCDILLFGSIFNILLS